VPLQIVADKAAAISLAKVCRASISIWNDESEK